MQKLIDNGQFEILNGGWGINDETISHYTGIIEQMSLGLQWLQKTFGDCARPRAGWGIGTAGHSLTHAEMLSRMGFDSFFFDTVDYQDYAQRAEKKELEMIWETLNKGKGYLVYHFITSKAFCH